MAKHKRQGHRESVSFGVVVHWEHLGRSYSSEFLARDLSDGGIQIEGTKGIETGTQVRIDVPQYGFPLQAAVRYCVSSGTMLSIGLEFCADTRRSLRASKKDADHYEVLQLSPRADAETVHRVFRMMAARFHPDNPESGDSEKFILLTEAYAVLGDGQKRAQYDAMRAARMPAPLPVFRAREFVDEKEGEANRRLGVLCLLYAQRRRSPEHPNVSLLDVETLMGYPREYLEFTFWYLRQKSYIERTDGSDFALTAAGVDFVEKRMSSNTVLQPLLESGLYCQPTMDRQYDSSCMHVQ